jgi:hypothetical protein
VASVSPHSIPPLRARPRGRSKLRVGVFADAAEQPRWAVDALARIAASDYAEIAVIAVRGDTDASVSPMLLKAYGQVDRWIFGSANDPLKPTPLDGLVPPTQRIPLVADDRAWRARVANLRLDVAFVLGSVEDDALEGLARYGTWRHCFGDANAVQAELAGVREVIDEKPIVGAGLRILRRGGEARVACQSWSRTVPFSLARSHDRLFGKAADFLGRSLKRLYEDGEGWLETSAVPAPLAEPEPLPGVVDTMRGVATLGARIAKRTIEHCFTVGQWSLAFRFAPVETWDGSLDGFHRLMPPCDRFWADPFPISVNGRHYIFFEDLPFSTGKGHISVIEIDRSGNASAPVKVIENDFHMSYPFLIEDGGELYMVPETAYDNTVQIYRCEEFPYRWKRHGVLLDGAFIADATLHREDDRWWMFANIGTPEAGADDELHIFSSDALFGKWKAHRANPVKSDVRSSRPAGRLFRQGGQLYRPGQICAPIYGSGIALHRVTHLSEDRYSEEEERRIVPCERQRARGDEPLLGLHTINRAGDLSVTDAFVRRRRF